MPTNTDIANIPEVSNENNDITEHLDPTTETADAFSPIPEPMCLYAFVSKYLASRRTPHITPEFSSFILYDTHNFCCLAEVREQSKQTEIECHLFVLGRECEEYEVGNQMKNIISFSQLEKLLDTLAYKKYAKESQMMTSRMCFSNYTSPLQEGFAIEPRVSVLFTASV